MRFTEIPKGFKTYLPEEAERKEFIEEKLKKVASLWGYEPIIPPEIEFLKTFKVVYNGFEEISFKLVDRDTGKLLAVRPDFTPQVARIVASSFKDEEPPFRFYYSGKVFRDREGERESCQFGIELIGVPDVEADAEVIAVVANMLKELGLKSFQIDIGHSEFVVGALSELELEGEENLLSVLKHKDISGLDLFIEEKGIAGERAEKLRILLELYGREEVLSRAEETFSGKKTRRAIAELREVLKILESYGFADRVIFDLTEKRELDYYTGITYEVFHPLYGFSLGSGGRYDGLPAKFGRDVPATGIALSIDALQELLEKKSLFRRIKRDFYIVDVRKELHRAYKLAKELREKGFTAARDIVKRDWRESVRIAFEKGFKVVILLGEGEEESFIFTSPHRSFKVKGTLIDEAVKVLESGV
ncbi:MAG: ATP phosphoribosyltransferase regulatory subunit [Desulfurobacteriaceae bacterium]